MRHVGTRGICKEVAMLLPIHHAVLRTRVEGASIGRAAECARTAVASAVLGPTGTSRGSPHKGGANSPGLQGVVGEGAEVAPMPAIGIL